MSGPTCIVCGRRIAKRTRSIWFNRPWGNYREGDRESKIDGQIIEVFLAERPADRIEAQRHTNDMIISSSRDNDGRLRQVGTWDGESYVDEFFCTNACAQQQGYAAAQLGHRFTWRRDK